MPTGDAGVGVDSGMQPDMTLPPPAAPTLYDPAIPILVHGAAELGSGLAVVGTTPSDFEVDESREAVAFHADASGNVVWSSRFGDPSMDQFLAVARRGATVLAAGVTRGYSVTGANNNDALLVRVDTAGLGAAFNWGTPDDELLFGLFDGGQVAEWIGVGEYTTGAERDGLVAAFDANLQPLWASAFDAGADDYFSSGVVLGDVVYVVGSTGTRGVPDMRRALVAAVDSSTVQWAQRSVLPGTAISATAGLEGQQFGVAGGLSDGTNTAPMVIRFAPDGTFSGRRFAVAGAFAATNTWFTAQDSYVATGARGNLTPFVMNVDAAAHADVIDFDPGIVTAGFLPTPIISTASVQRVVLQGANQTALDVPFSLTPEARCAANAPGVVGTAVPSDALETLILSRVDLTFDGGEIGAPRSSTIAVTSQAMACTP